MENTQFTVIDFSASWCGPCKMFAPVFEKVKLNFAEKCKFRKVDVDEESDFAQKHNILSVPTVVLFAGEKEVARISGYLSEPQFVNFLKQNGV